jgi:hypothetical protein
MVRIEQRLSLSEMVNGLCSKYVRNVPLDEMDARRPARLSAAKIVEAVRDEYAYYGTNAVWTWADSLCTDDADEASAWARGVILAAFPDLGVHEG